MDTQYYRYAAHKGGVIWGLGVVASDAIDDALTKHKQFAPDIEVDEFNFKVNPISPVLAFYVELHGGDEVSFVHCGDTLLLSHRNRVY